MGKSFKSGNSLIDNVVKENYGAFEAVITGVLLDDIAKVRSLAISKYLDDALVSSFVKNTRKVNNDDLQRVLLQGMVYEKISEPVFSRVAINIHNIKEEIGVKKTCDVFKQIMLDELNGNIMLINISLMIKLGEIKNGNS